MDAWASWDPKRAPRTIEDLQETGRGDNNRDHFIVTGSIEYDRSTEDQKRTNEWLTEERVNRRI